MRIESRRTLLLICEWLVIATFVGSFSAPTNVDAQQFRAMANASQSMVASRPRHSRVAPIETKNFVVYANDQNLARKVSAEAERFRSELAIQWLGKEIPAWRDKCPITVEVGRNAGGETSFAFVPGREGKGMPIDWQMKIFGPPNRILDAVLPHEITHTIFATHFGRPLPRWADEGACTTVEHESEKQKNHKMLLEFLKSKPSRGIPFNRMFTMRNYPHDILPLYAQGYSLARFLIMKKGRRHFVDFVSAGLQNEGRYNELRAWDMATGEYYGYKDLSDLQIQWLGWVKNGSKDSRQNPIASKLGELASTPNGSKSSGSLSAISQNANATDSRIGNTDGQIGLASFVESSPRTTGVLPDKSSDSTVSAPPQTFTSSANGSWYAREMKKGDQIARTQTSRASNRTRKVPSLDEINPSSPIARDSRLPQQYVVPATLWR